MSGSTPTTEANGLSRKAEPQRPLPCHGSPGFPKCAALSVQPWDQLMGGWKGRDAGISSLQMDSQRAVPSFTYMHSKYEE